MKRMLLALLLLPLFAQAQIITTIAGPGTSGVGDGEPATAATLGNPNSGIFDVYGSFYFVEITGERIRKINRFGIITSIAGTGVGGYTGDGGPATAAEIQEPDGLTFDNKGNLYFAQTYNSTIRKVDAATGIISTVAGTGTAGFSGDGGPATAAQIDDPQDIWSDKHGNLYIADGSNYRIRKIDTSGIISTIAGNGTYASTFGVPATSTGLVFPYCVTTDDDGNVYIGNERVMKVDKSGILSNIVGNGLWPYIGEGFPATNAQLIPQRIRFDSFGNLFIADRHNQRVYKVDAAGIFHLVAGNGTASYGGDGGLATAAGFYGVCGVAIDSCGNLYITEVDNNRIRKVTYPHCGYLDVPEIAIGNELSIYPNPATTSLTISSPDQITSVAITNLIGQTVYNNAYHNEQVQVDVSNLPAGMYLIRINGTEVRKFVKE